MCHSVITKKFLLVVCLAVGAARLFFTINYWIKNNEDALEEIIRISFPGYKFTFIATLGSPGLLNVQDAVSVMQFAWIILAFWAYTLPSASALSCFAFYLISDIFKINYYHKTAVVLNYINLFEIILLTDSIYWWEKTLKKITEKEDQIIASVALNALSANYLIVLCELAITTCGVLIHVTNFPLTHITLAVYCSYVFFIIGSIIDNLKKGFSERGKIISPEIILIYSLISVLANGHIRLRSFTVNTLIVAPLLVVTMSLLYKLYLASKYTEKRADEKILLRVV